MRPGLPQPRKGVPPPGFEKVRPSGGAPAPGQQLFGFEVADQNAQQLAHGAGASYLHFSDFSKLLRSASTQIALSTRIRHILC